MADAVAADELWLTPADAYTRAPDDARPPAPRAPSGAGGPGCNASKGRCFTGPYIARGEA